MSEHTFRTREDCSCTEDLLPFACPICDGGLKWCKVCNGAEGSLPFECPGEPMTEAQEKAVQAGTLNFFAGGWWSAGTPQSVFFCR